MKKYFKTLAAFALVASFLSVPIADASSLPVGGTSYTLSGAGITSTQTTVQLTSFTTPDGRLITMSNFGTVGYGALDPQTNSKLEDISFTGITQNANGSATLTGVSRGLDFIYPYSANAILDHAHSGGSTFILTNTAGYYYNEFTMNNNNNLFTWPSASTSPATKGYVDFVAFNGAAVINANTTNKGVVQIATGLQAASSTATGSTGAYLDLSSSISTSTGGTSAALHVVVTNNSGLIDPSFISLATSTTIGSTYAFNIGRTEWVATSTQFFTVPNGIKTVHIRLVGGGGGGASTGGGGGGGGYSEGDVSLIGTTSVYVTVGTGGTGGNGGAGTGGGTTSFGTFMQATGGSAGTFDSGGSNGAYAGGVGGIGSGGQLNGNGQPGGTGMFASGLAGNGVGGSSVFGGGANQSLGAVSYGSGGGAGNNVAGVGAVGAVIVEY